MERQTIIYLSIGALVVAGIAALALTRGGDADVQEPVDLAANGTHSVTAHADRRTGTVVAFFEVEHTGEVATKIRILLVGPDGTTIAFRDHTLQIGEHERFEARRGYSNGGPAGEYTARIEIKEGSARVVRGGVDFR